MQPTASASAAPLPPLPDLQSSAGTGGAPGGAGQQDLMASLLSGIAPVKQGVDMILQGAKMVVQSGAVAGAEQPCAQIVALATSLLPMAAQQALQPGSGGAVPPAGAPQGGIPPMG